MKATVRGGVQAGEPLATKTEYVAGQGSVHSVRPKGGWQSYLGFLGYKILYTLHFRERYKI